MAQFRLVFVTVVATLLQPVTGVTICASELRGAEREALTVVPEPAALLILGIGLVAVARRLRFVWTRP